MRILTLSFVCLFALSAHTPVALSQADRERLWTEGSGSGGLDPSGPVSMTAFAELASAASPSVVNIGVVRDAPQGPSMGFMPFFGQPQAPQGRGQGTGFIIHRDGYVLTNHHVVEKAREITLTLHDDRTYRAEVVGTHPQLDVALLKFKPSEAVTVAPLGNSNHLRIGEWVVAIGNPFGLSHTVTAGIVSAKGRRDVQPGNQPMYANFIQTDASINPGNSGGPLLNVRGEVIGINTAINAAGQGIGFAVPIEMVKTVIPQLRQGRVSRSYLGVRLAPVTHGLAKRLGLKRPSGALVREVELNQPADKAGIQPGDVITHWNGEPVADIGDLSWRASTAGTAREVTLKLLRSGREHTLSTRLADFPEATRTSWNEPRKPRNKKRAAVGVERLGLAVTALSPPQGSRLGLKRGRGLKVQEVDRGSAAHIAGIERGDVIVEVNGRPARGDAELFQGMVDKTAQGEVLSLLIQRDDRRIYLTFTL